jgi:DNA repair exonuclease SbcCD ATPase subunit
MITTLSLSSYGRFREAEFRLAPVTVFLGDNESGKTTIRDAVFDQLCTPRENTRSGKALKARYGAARQATLLFDGDALAFDAALFENLLCLEGGQVDIDTSKGHWVKQVKSKLFSGGIDPQLILREMEDEASDKGSLRHNKRLKGLEAKKAEASRKREELCSKRDSILAQELEAATLAKEIEIGRSRLDDLARQKSSIEETLAREREVDRYQAAEQDLRLLRDVSKLRTELDKLSLFAVDRTDEIGKLDQDRAERERAVAGSEASLEAVRESLWSVEQKIGCLQSSSYDAKTRGAEAQRFLDRLEQFQAGAPSTVTVTWNRALLVAGLLLAAGGLVMATLLHGVAASAASVAVGLMGCILCVLLARKLVVGPDVTAAERFRATLRDQWNNAGHEAMVADSLDGMRQFLTMMRDEEVSLNRELRAACSQRDQLNQRFNAARKELEKRRDSRERTMREINSWFHTQGVGSRDEYQRRLAKRSSLAQQLRSLEAEVTERLADSAGEGVADLEQEVLRTLRDLEMRGIPPTGLDDGERQRLAGELDHLVARQRQLRQEVHDQEKSLSNRRGLVQGGLDDLPQLIVETEAELYRTRAALEDITQRKASARLARDIFRDLMHGIDSSLEGLAAEISSSYARIVGETRDVKVTGLATNRIHPEDASGDLRPIEGLSAGTKDAFFLAAKLVLARKAQDGQALVVLDDPFLLLDDRRRDRSLELLRDFHDRTGWQILLMTKDEGTAEAASKVFAPPSLATIRLDSSAPNSKSKASAPRPRTAPSGAAA